MKLSSEMLSSYVLSYVLSFQTDSQRMLAARLQVAKQMDWLRKVEHGLDVAVAPQQALGSQLSGAPLVSH